MRLHYKGKFSGNENDLPKREHPCNAVKFEEPKSSKSFSLVGNIVAILIILICLICLVLRVGGWNSFDQLITVQPWGLMLGPVLYVLSIIPHELLHGACYREDVFLYTWLSKGMLFIVGAEDFSKMRFIITLLLPNIVFGFIPFGLYMLFPSHFLWLGTLGALSIGSGAGDYLNIINVLKQVPKGAKIYASGFNNYWYKPELHVCAEA